MKAEEAKLDSAPQCQHRAAVCCKASNQPCSAAHRWTLDRLKNVKEFEGNKQYVSEVLSILMQSSTANQVKLASMSGIDAILSCVFPYKGRNARSDGEEEYVANLFGCLCSCLMPAENKAKFMQVCQLGPPSRQITLPMFVPSFVA